jgi:hypothetical protein
MAKQEEKKIDRCKYAHHHFNGEYSCIEAGMANDKAMPTDEAKCETCEKYKSRYIEYPLTIDSIDVEPINTDSLNAKTGDFVAVRPCGDEYGGKTYFGIFIGDLPIQSMVSFNEKTRTLRVSTMGNPAMLVPQLNKIIYGCGSWWRKIKSEKDLKAITDRDINDTWYVKMAHQMMQQRRKSSIELKEGDRFQQAWKGCKEPMWFKVLSIDRPNNSLRVECHSHNGDMHEEEWDDLDVTESAFDVGEYKMIEDKED